jgi:hypothetical protein
MPDQKSVDIGGEAKTLARTIRDINQSLYLPDTLYKADAITPVRGRTYTLLFGLREKLKASGSTPEIFEQVKDAIKSLEAFYYPVLQLENLSDRLAGNPSVQVRGELESQWRDCCRSLLDLSDPVSRNLDSLSEMAEGWTAVPVPAVDPAAAGEASAGTNGGPRSGTGRKRKAG